MDNQTHKLNPEKWIDLYCDYLYQYAYFRVNSAELAEDLVQETFLSGYHAKDSFKGNSTEKTWLVTILKNKIIDYYRKNTSGKEVALPDRDYHFDWNGPVPGHWNESYAPKKWDTSMEELMENIEFYEILNKCLSKLPVKWAATFSLKVMEELKNEEICKQLGITTSNLWVILHRAKLMLRECLEKNWFEK